MCGIPSSIKYRVSLLRALVNQFNEDDAAINQINLLICLIDALFTARCLVLRTIQAAEDYSEYLHARRNKPSRTVNWLQCVRSSRYSVFICNLVSSSS